MKACAFRHLEFNGLFPVLEPGAWEGGGDIRCDAMFHNGTEENLSSLREQAAAQRGVMMEAGWEACEGVSVVQRWRVYEAVSVQS